MSATSPRPGPSPGPSSTTSELAGELPEAFTPDIKQHGFESRQLWDPPAAIPEDIGRAVQDYVDRQVDSVQKTIFPFHRL